MYLVFGTQQIIRKRPSKARCRGLYAGKYAVYMYQSFCGFKKASAADLRSISAQQPARVSNRAFLCLYVENHNPPPIAFGYVQWLIEVVRRGKMAKLFDKYNETDASEFCRIEIDPLPEVGRDLRQKCMPYIYSFT